MIVNVKGEEVKLPDFFIIGASRGGTTTLYFLLNQHPNIFFPEQKEPFFFSFNEQPPPYKDSDLSGIGGKKVIWKFEDYVKLFEIAKDDQIIGESSTSYLYTYDLSIEHMRSLYGEKCKEVRIVAVLRNPVDRAFSHYLLLVKSGREPFPFEKAIHPPIIERRLAKLWDYDYIEYGMYYKRIKAYMDTFQHVKIYLFEDLLEPKRLLEDLFTFLGIDSDITIDTNIMANPSGVPASRLFVHFLLKAPKYGRIFIPGKYRLQLVRIRDALLRRLMKRPRMERATRKKLIDVFRSDVLELQKLIHRDLSPWLEEENES